MSAEISVLVVVTDRFGANFNLKPLLRITTPREVAALRG
jgi:hypothetical protein